MTTRALVTGASEGIGRVFARALAGQGYQITAVARNEARLRSLVDELGPGHEVLAADLSDAAAQRRVADELGRGHYALLVNNAGVGLAGGFADMPLERTLTMMHLNCDALVCLAYAFLQHAEPGDALINVSSTLAFLPMATLGAYCGSKAFVTAFSESLWYEQKRRGVYVMGLCPGITATGFHANAGAREDLPKRLTQTPEQVVAIALKALQHRRKPTIICGRQNALFAWLLRVLPRKAAVSLMSRVAGHEPNH